MRLCSTDKFKARVANQGSASITDQGHIFAIQQALDQLINLVAFIMLMASGQRCLNIKVFKQLC